MSHTFRAEDGTTFISNGDLSGEVKIHAIPCYDGAGNCYFHVSGAALLEFVANYVRMQKITIIEEMTDMEVLLDR